ncbi:hypothetical protein HD554DRAFT_1577967 [Boletus coccyginus]|nr:hypothetical protein HD554DRAFT_1577967 [Boletus coccyginus]
MVRFWLHFSSLLFSIFRLHLVDFLFLLPWLPFAAWISLDLRVLNSTDAHQATVLSYAFRHHLLLHSYSGHESSQLLSPGIPDATPPRCSIDHHSTTFTTANFSPSQLCHLFSAGTPLANDSFPSCSPRRIRGIIHPCDPLFDFSSACSASKIVPWLSSTSTRTILKSQRLRLCSLTTSFYPIEFPSATFSSTFQIPTVPSVSDNIDAITPSHPSVADTSDVSEKSKFHIDCLSTPTTSLLFAIAVAPSRSSRNCQQREHTLCHHFYPSLHDDAFPPSSLDSLHMPSLQLAHLGRGDRSRAVVATWVLARA